MPKLHFGSRGGVYYKKNGKKVYVPKNNFGGDVFDEIKGYIKSQEVRLPNITDYMLYFPKFSDNLLTLNPNGEKAINHLLNPKIRNTKTFLIREVVPETDKGYCNHLLNILRNLQLDIKHLKKTGNKGHTRLVEASREIIGIIYELKNEGRDTGCLVSYKEQFHPKDDESPSMSFQERMKYLS